MEFFQAIAQENTAILILLAVLALGTAAVAALAANLSFRQIPKLKQELLSARRSMEDERLKVENNRLKVEGLGMVKEELSAKEFQDAYAVIQDAWRLGDRRYPRQIEGHVNTILSTLDFIGILVDLECVDRDLLLYRYGGMLKSLDYALENLKGRDNSQVPALTQKYPKGYRLLKEINLKETQPPL
jgi:hypothetical protein